ncbi:hypothetical protein TA3x_000554 [Tundrisphaera sp. TA3]|uniref:hypothetical protein n=1 Tax=Tundrisphaera sp. TA3 TaxID=3435775 RepID=UPI003EBB1E7F
MSTADDSYLKSSFIESLVEHVFISEVLQEVFYAFGETVEVLRSEVDASGYDVVFECNGVMRHVQLKTSKPEAQSKGQNVNLALSGKPGGCVVWVVRDEDRATRRIRLSYLFFGGEAGHPLPPIVDLKVAKHAKATKGVKLERPRIRVIPKGRFRRVSTTRELVGLLFGFRATPDEATLQAILSDAEDNEVVDE